MYLFHGYAKNWEMHPLLPSESKPSGARGIYSLKMPGSTKFKMKNTPRQNFDSGGSI